jgi:phosphoenolpyruvate carboxylase
MSTQHPDNVAMPFFAQSAPLTAEDEVREAYYAFSHLGCDEQMWDFEGKEVDGHVVEKLLTTYESFFAEHPIGESVHLTPRIPNPALEPTQAKIVLEVLQSLPRHADIARVFYDRERPPILELIHPMTTSARELDRVREYYERFVAGMEHETLGHDERPLGAWFGRFSPATVRMIPLIEDREHLLAADDLVRDYLRGKELDHMRVFIARSDPALNYGYFSAVLLALVALQRLAALEAETGVAIYPVIGVGSVPFRGGLAPRNIDRVLATYPSVQTYTIQSAFKYDHPPDAVRDGIARVLAHERGAALTIDEERAVELLDRLVVRYQTEVQQLAPLVNTVARAVPRRRLRKLHVGLFGYNRATAGVSLPRAIAFCAALYSIGLPPEIIGLAAVTDADWAWLRATIPSIDSELADAMRYLDRDDLAWLPPLVRESVERALSLINAGESDAEHVEISREVRRIAQAGGAQMTELIVRAAALRHFLG